MVYLTDLDKAAALSGLKVVTIPGWKTRGRPSSTGGFKAKAVVVHHTADTLNKFKPVAARSLRERVYAAGTLLRGFSTLPGPLCHIGLGRDGTVYIVAAGRANHAGKVRNIGVLSAGDGNAQSIGIEAMNSGSEGWTDAQLDAYHRLCAALCAYYGWSRSAVYGHGEVSTAGKWDPGVNGKMINMNTFRSKVRAQFGGRKVVMKKGTFVVGPNGATAYAAPSREAKKVKNRKAGFKVNTVAVTDNGWWVAHKSGIWYSVSDLKRV